MRAGIAIPLLIAVGCIASASAAIAQTGIASTDDFEQCRREETMAELRLKACTAVIEDSSRIDEVRAEAFLNRGMAHAQLGDTSAAIADYTQGLKLNPKNRALYNRRGLAYELEGKRDLAIADFTAALSIDPEDIEALVYRGLSYAEAGDYNQAIVDFDTALALNPNDADVLVFRGETREALGDRDKAIEDYRKALSLDPQNEFAEAGLKRLGAKRD
jgi:tetratricopeptide (TPR) repeat protein